MQQMPPYQLPSPGPRRVTMKVKLPISKDRIPVEMAADDTVWKLKEKIVALEGMQGVTEHRIVLFPCLLPVGMWSPNIDVFLKWCVPVSRGSSSVFRKQTVVLTLMDWEEERKILVEVNLKDNVRLGIRNHLKPFFQRRQRFSFPSFGLFCYLYKQQVMNTQESFEWHGVRDGDTIIFFIGYPDDMAPFVFWSLESLIDSAQS